MNIPAYRREDARSAPLARRRQSAVALISRPKAIRCHPLLSLRDACGFKFANDGHDSCADRSIMSTGALYVDLAREMS